MGMPKTKAECDKAIADKKVQIANAKATVASYKSQGFTQAAKTHQGWVAKYQAELAELQALKKRLK